MNATERLQATETYEAARAAIAMHIELEKRIAAEISNGQKEYPEGHKHFFALCLANFPMETREFATKVEDIFNKAADEILVKLQSA